MSDDDTEFVERYRALVESIVRSVQAQLRINTDTADLVAFGLMGLVEARARYDASRGTQFSTFAYYRIRGAVFDGLGKMSRVPRSVVRRSRALLLLDAESELAAETKTNPNTGIDPKHIAIDAIADILSRAATAYTLTALTTPAPSPEDDASHQESLEALRKATLVLPERERLVIQAHYIDDRNLDDIAKDLGLSKSWMSRLHAKALDHLRAAMTGEETR